MVLHSRFSFLSLWNLYHPISIPRSAELLPLAKRGHYRAAVTAYPFRPAVPGQPAERTPPEIAEPSEKTAVPTPPA